MMTEQTQNPFATADAAWPPRTPQSPALPALVEGEAPDRLAFDPVRLRARLDGWTPERQRLFVEELAECGVVKEAAARVGMSEQSAFNLRRRAGSESFNLAWEAAVRLGAERLRSIAYERAVTGTVKRHYYKGQVVGEDRVYDNRLLVYLLGKTEPVVDALAVRNVARDWDSWMQAIEQGLDRPMPSLDAVEAPVWQTDDGEWWTSFPAPPGFEGRQYIPEEDDDEYQRECTPVEVEAIEKAQAREEAENARRRDLYFNPERMKLRARR